MIIGYIILYKMFWGFSRSGRIDDFPLRTVLHYLGGGGHNISNYKDDIIIDDIIIDDILYGRFMWNLDYRSVKNLFNIMSDKKDVESLVLVYRNGKITHGVKD